MCETYVHYQLLNDTCEAADGYYLDSNSTPVKCEIYGCYLCSDSLTCTFCSEINNFAMDLATGDCVCDSTLYFVPHPTQDVCICEPGMYLSLNGTNATCEFVPLCPDPNSGCLTCAPGGGSC